MRTLLAVNTLTSVNSQVYSSHLNLAFRMGRDTKDEFLLYTGYRMSIDNFRNQAARYAILGGFDYLMFLDDDILIPRDTYEYLKAADKDIVTPFVYIRGYPFKPMFFKSIMLGEEQGITPFVDWEEHVDKDNYLLECAAIGFSCALIKVELLKKIKPAWFVTGVNHTEDVYFCVKARTLLNNEVSIFVDTRIEAGHLLDAEFIAKSTRAALMTLHETLNPTLKAQVEREATGRGDRTEKQVEENIRLVQAAPIMLKEDAADETQFGLR